MTYTGEKIAATVNGRRYVRKMFFQWIAYGNDPRAERLPFITINGVLYLVFRRNGKPCSVCKWSDYAALAE